MLRFADIGDVTLRYAAPPDRAIDLVLIHEMGGALESWDGVVARLPVDGHVLRYDLRGHGVSEKIRAPCTMADAVRDLVGLLDHVGARGPVMLCGSALGGGIALATAAAHPARVAGIVACAPALGVSVEARPRVEVMADRIAREGMRWLVDTDMLPQTFPPEMRTDPEAFERFRGVQLANDPASFAATWRMLASADIAGLAERIACPVEILAGRRDPARKPEVHQAYSARMAHGVCTVVDSGHFMAVQTPGLVVEAIARMRVRIGSASVVTP